MSIKRSIENIRARLDPGEHVSRSSNATAAPFMNNNNNVKSVLSVGGQKKANANAGANNGAVQNDNERCSFVVTVVTFLSLFPLLTFVVEFRGTS